MAKGFQAEFSLSRVSPQAIPRRKWAQGGAGTPFKPADAAWGPFAINPSGWGDSRRDAASSSSSLEPPDFIVSRVSAMPIREKAFVAFLASLGWRPSAAPTHYLDGLL